MKRLFCLFALCGLLLFGATPATVRAAAPPDIGAAAGVLIDLDTGAILWQKDCHQPLPPASTTKVMTALLTANLVEPTEVFTVSAAGAAVGESSAHLTAGEELAAGDLLACALLISANDACYVLGENIAGAEPLFVSMMNLKAAALGGNNSVFANTNGLPDEGHFMSPYDLALFARNALAKPLFAQLVDTPYAYTDSGSYRRYLKNTNRLVRTYPEIDGVKTGTTDAAGACLAASMSRDGRRVLAVVFHSPDRFGEAYRLLNYGIDQFQNISLCRQGEIWAQTADYTLVAACDGLVTVPKDAPGLQPQLIWSDTGEQAWLLCQQQGLEDVTINLTVKYDQQKQGTSSFLEKMKQIVN